MREFVQFYDQPYGLVGQMLVRVKFRDTPYKEKSFIFKWFRFSIVVALSPKIELAS